jgi:hypothetical protein
LGLQKFKKQISQNNMDKLQSAITFINSNSLVGIKAGKERNSFLDIWMVVVENRIFARSWGFAENSWYNTFLKEPSGQIKCGEYIFDIKATAINHEMELSIKINEAYLAKYNHGDNSFYALGITEKEHVDKTMEFELV